MCVYFSNIKVFEISLANIKRMLVEAFKKLIFGFHEKNA